MEYKNLLLYLGYGNAETDNDASLFFIREFTHFLESSARADDLYKVYGDLPIGFIMKIHLPTDVVVDHLKILTKEDDTGWFSWTKDTTSLLIKVMGMFRKFQEAADYFWKNPKLLTEIYDNLDGHSEILGQPKSNRILFASVLNVFAQRDSSSKTKITKNALLNGNGYFIESNILELNDTLNTIKGIISFEWDFDYEDAVFLQQKKIVTKTTEQRETDEFGKGGSTVEQTQTSSENVDPGYLYHPMNLVHFIDKGQEKANLVTALFIKAIADEEEWAEVMENIRIGGDIFAIIAGFVTMGLTGNLSVLAIADLGLASIDLALMNEDVKKWISDLPGGKWFVENWDTIYALIGAGILSIVMIEGILTRGPALLETIRNLKNVKGNYLIFTKQLEKLVEELQAYRLRNPGNVIEEVVLTGEKNGLLKKLLKPFLGKDADTDYILEQLVKRKISVKKAGDNLYEIYYNGKLVTVTDASEAGAFLKNNFWKTERQLEGTMLNEARRSKRSKKDFESILKEREERIQKYEEILNNWDSKEHIKGISKLKIIEYIQGFTKHLDALSALIKENKIIISIQSDADFLEIFDLFADSSQKARGTKNLSAFAYGDIIYVKETDFIGDFLDNICHEGSHCIDYLDKLNKKEIGTIRDQESRAFGHEMDFQKATGRKPIFGSEKEKLDHIDENYDNY